MVRRLTRFLLFALCLGGGYATAQEVDIEVDRTEVARGETLTLTIRVYDQRQGMQLDLTPLTDDFEVLGTRTSSQIRSINGQVESWTDYVVTLFPLSEGEITIPTLTINNVQTDPIEIAVVNQGPRSNQSDEELFLEIEVNKESVYVQEQLQFAVRLFYTINGIRNPQFTELEMEDTVIQMIGSPNQYERLIDGVRYGVYEKRYVIFPQRSGALEIPDILFRGDVTDGSSNFVFRNLNTRQVTAFTDGMSIDVLERPAAARNLEFWLPAQSITLEETWSTDLNDLEIGDSVVRTITMRAEGLDGAMLPPFSEDAIDGINLYNDPPEIERTFVDGSIVGTRTETATLVATRSGVIEIPQITIPWWNVGTGEMESSVIPATRLDIAAVAGALPSEQAVDSTGNLRELLETGPVVDQAMIDAQAEAEFIEVDALWFNAFIVLAVAVVLLSIYKLAIAPRQGQIGQFIAAQRHRLGEHFSPANNERVAFRQLRDACRARDLQRTRSALVTWCDHYIDGRTVRSMEDIQQQTETPELHRFAAGIQSLLFNLKQGDKREAGFEPEELLRAVETLRKGKRSRSRLQSREARYALPPLYKT
ncbi:MAG: BatD family protein [Pseudohongiellaceae bacterium]